MKNDAKNVIAALGASIVLSALPGTAAAVFGCGDLANAYGPIDYRKMTPTESTRVEGAHFTPGVETLVQRKSGPFGADIDYTLRVFPNSPRALLAMSRLGLREKNEKPVGTRYSVECYFDRALRFAPDDPMPRLVYAFYLRTHNRKGEALEQIDTAAKLKKDDTGYEFSYNMGLEYFEAGQYDKSLAYAQKAYAAGAPFPGLRKKLQNAGKWSDAKVE